MTDGQHVEDLDVIALQDTEQAGDGAGGRFTLGRLTRPRGPRPSGRLISAIRRQDAEAAQIDAD